ncbi:MAG: vWA domain-containing protein [Ignavibacteriota bacterium]
MMFTVIMPFLLIPLVGLGIDATVLYSVKVKLQTAVDGAALAAAQSLNAGLDLAAQSKAATLAADQFIRANIVTGASAGKTGYWGSYNLNDSNCTGSTSTAAGTPIGSGAPVTYDNSGTCVVISEDNQTMQRSVSLAASVNVPLIFMRIMGFSNGTVTSRGTAARRDVVMVLVLDRSTSMAPPDGSINSLLPAATYFVSQFQPGRDQIGLVAFGGSAIIAYPPADWGKDPATATLAGPDIHWADTPDSASAPNIYTSIKAIKAGSNTGTAEALMFAYKELVAANKPGALNVIVLFTDGQPNGISAYFNPTPVTNSSVLSSSPCTYRTDSGNTARSMIGWIGQGGGFKSGTATKNGSGINSLMQTNNTYRTTIGAWLANPNEPLIGGTPATNCKFATTGNGTNDYLDIKFPLADRYGNSTSGPSSVGAAHYTALDYQKSFIWTDNDQGCLNTSNGARTTWNPATSSVADACQVGLASWNAADMAAYQIHQHAGTTIKPVIYCLGYEGSGGDDPEFMTRLANIPTNPSTGAANSVYDSTQPKGMYIQVVKQADIMPAFESIVAEILRISL